MPTLPICLAISDLESEIQQTSSSMRIFASMLKFGDPRRPDMNDEKRGNEGGEGGGGTEMISVNGSPS